MARRLSGVRARRFSQPAASITLFEPGVDTGPGASALTRMPCGASSTACWRVKVSIAPLIEEYTQALVMPKDTATDERLMIEPPPRATRCGVAACVHQKTPLMPTSSMRWILSSGISTSGA